MRLPFSPGWIDWTQERTDSKDKEEYLSHTKKHAAMLSSCREAFKTKTAFLCSSARKTQRVQECLISGFMAGYAQRLTKAGMKEQCHGTMRFSSFFENAFGEADEAVHQHPLGELLPRHLSGADVLGLGFPVFTLVLDAGRMTNPTRISL